MPRKSVAVKTPAVIASRLTKRVHQRSAPGISERTLQVRGKLVQNLRYLITVSANLCMHLHLRGFTLIKQLVQKNDITPQVRQCHHR